MPDLTTKPAEFTITLPSGPILCGYCHEEEDDWPAEPKARALLTLGYIRFTGFRSLGVGPAGEIVVLFEVETLSGKPTGYLPHLCTAVPAEVYAEYADDVAASVARRGAPDA
jgi:hypothetical protein